MHRKLARPSARGPSGTFQLLEGITTSVHHLLYLFSAHDHHDHRGTRLNSALCSPWRWSYEVICEVGIIRAHHQSGEKIAFNCDYRGGSGSPRLRSLTESVRPSVHPSVRPSVYPFFRFVPLQLRCTHPRVGRYRDLSNTSLDTYRLPLTSHPEVRLASINKLTLWKKHECRSRFEISFTYQRESNVACFSRKHATRVGGLRWEKGAE